MRPSKRVSRGIVSVTCLHKALILLLVLATTTTFAPGKGLAESEFSGGTGTLSDPYLIQTAQHLNNVRNHLSAHHRLISDIDLHTYLSEGGGHSADAGWVPIGTVENPFTGSLDGDMHTIKGLVINRPQADNVGLLGVTGWRAVISNVVLLDVAITGREMVGSLVGCCRDTAITGSGSTGVVTGGTGRVGGLLGYQYRGSITRCYSEALVTGAGGLASWVGGLVGSSYYGTISGCDASGDVQNGSIAGHMIGFGNGVGGLVGGTDHGTIRDCFATGSVTGEQNAGGLVGNSVGGSIVGSRALGAVTITGVGYNAGGLVGLSSGVMITACSAGGRVTVSADDGGRFGGGLVGYGELSTIVGSFATGAVTGDSNSEAMGGLAGSLDRSDAIASYATGAVEGNYSVGGLVGISHRSTITHCFAQGRVSGEEPWEIGGLVGINGTDAQIARSYALGSVYGNRAGGLVGSNVGSITDAYAKGDVVTGGYHKYATPEGGFDVIWAFGGVAGGLVADNKGVINNSYSTGAVSGSSQYDLHIAGLVAINWIGTISNSFTTGYVRGHTSDDERYLRVSEGVLWGSIGGCTVLSSTQMKQRAVFVSAGWNFEDIWNIANSATYPFLQPGGETISVRGRVGTAFDYGFGGLMLKLSDIPIIALTEAGLEVGRTYSDDQGFFELNLPSTLANTRYRLRAELRDKDGTFTVRSQRGFDGEVVYLERQPLTGSQRNVAMVFDPGFAYAADSMTVEQKDVLRDAAVYYGYTYRAARYARIDLALTMDHRLPVDVYLFSEAEGTWYCPVDSVINICAGTSRRPFESRFTSPNSPSNREYHEFGHHIHTDSLMGGEDQMPGLLQGDVNHGGVMNLDSTDSLTEGFAVFYALLVQGHPIYRIDGTRINLQDNWHRVGRGVDGYWVMQPFEQLNVASLLWDLVDDDNEAGDRVTIPIGELWLLLQSPEIVTVRSLYEALHAKYGHLFTDPHDELSDIDRLFVMHRFYSDANRNGRWDPGEAIGYSDWYLSRSVSHGYVRPSLWLSQGILMDVSVVDADGAALKPQDFGLAVFYPESERNYRYESAVDAEGRLTIIVPPESLYLEISPIMAGYTATQVLTLEPDGFWEAVLEAVEDERETFMSHTFVMTASQVPEPAGVVAEVVDESSVLLSWEIPGGAAEILLVRTTADELAAAPLAAISLYRGSDSSYHDQDVLADVQYRYTLFAVREDEISVGVSVTVWPQSPIAYTVSYDGNGHTGGSPPTDYASYEQGATVFVLDNTGDLMKTGHTFVGWNTAADGSGSAYASGDSFSMGSADATLYAQWLGTSGAITGTIRLRDRSDHSAVVLEVMGTDRWMHAAPDGSIMIEDVMPGTYQLRVTAVEPSTGLVLPYPALISGGWVVVRAGEITAVPEIVLSVGDLWGPDGTADGRIDILDLAYLAQRYAELVSETDTADLNRDGVIDLYDLVKVARSFGWQPPDWWAGRITFSLHQIVEEVRLEYDLPALGGAIVTLEDAQVARGTDGLRRVNSEPKVTDADLWHLGSNFKSFTAMLAAIAVDRGEISWSTTVADVFPELESVMRDEYAEVTLRDLMAQCSGFPRDPSPQAIVGETRVEQRNAVTAWAVSQAPVSVRGTYCYTNTGYIVAAAMMDRVLGESFEESMRSLVFAPLGITDAGFGPQATAGSSLQPSGHRLVDGEWDVADSFDNPPVYASAGGAHMSIASWAKFLQEVLRVESGTPTIVSTSAGRETTSAITQMDELDSYGLGWVVTSRVWANGKVLVHSGTNTVNSSVAWVAPARNLAVLAVTNSFDGTEAERTWQALDALSARLILFYGEIAD